MVNNSCRNGLACATLTQMCTCAFRNPNMRFEVYPWHIYMTDIHGFRSSV